MNRTQPSLDEAIEWAVATLRSELAVCLARVVAMHEDDELYLNTLSEPSKAWAALFEAALILICSSSAAILFSLSLPFTVVVPVDRLDDTWLDGTALACSLLTALRLIGAPIAAGVPIEHYCTPERVYGLLS